MKLIDDIVVDKDGREVKAQIATCDECGWCEFNIFVVHGHNHIECCGCTKTFCQQAGQCGTYQQ